MDHTILRLHVTKLLISLSGRLEWLIHKNLMTRVLHPLVVLTLFITNLYIFKPTAMASGFTPQEKDQSNQYMVVDSKNSQPQTRISISMKKPRLGIRPELPINDLALATQTGQQVIRNESFVSPSPLLFVENVGQVDTRYNFQVLGQIDSTFLSKDAIWFSKLEPELEQAMEQLIPTELGPVPTPGPGYAQDGQSEKPRKGVNVRLQFVGANPNPVIEGFNPIDTTISYFLGNDPGQWRADVPVWGGVRYIDLYPGIDLEISSLVGAWSWQLVVKDIQEFNQAQDLLAPRGIRLHVEGATTLEVSGTEMKITTEVGDLKLPMLQTVASEETAKDNSFTTSSIIPTIESGEIIILHPGFSEENLGISPTLENGEMVIPDPDPDSITAPERSPEPPVSDGGFIPTAMIEAASINSVSSQTIYSTYLGRGSARSIVVDDDMNSYITGKADITFPVTPGAFQTTFKGDMEIFVAKLNSAGNSLLFATFLGGIGLDESRDIAIDVDKDIYITGRTLSSDFPTTPGAFNQTDYLGSFVTKINSSGTGLVYSTFIGGSGGDQGFSIAVDSAKQAYFLGQTSSYDFPTTAGAYDRTINGGYDGVVTKLNSDGSGLIYSTFIGGSNADCEVGGDARECTLEVDASEAAYVTGPTYSTNFPTTPGAFDRTYNGNEDAFVLKLNPSGSGLIYSTYLGGSGQDCRESCAITIDPTGSAYVTGSTNSTDFFGSSFGNWDVFVVKLSPTGNELTYTNRIGGTNMDFSNEIALNEFGEVFIIGDTFSSDLGVSDNAEQPNLLGPRDAFLARVNYLGNRVNYLSYWGGMAQEIGFGITVDSVGEIYVTGWTESGDFPHTEGAYKTVGTGSDSFVTKFSSGPILSESSTNSDCKAKSGHSDSRECPIATSQTQGAAGDPINTRTGGFDYSIGDLAMNTSAGILTFQRLYSSLATEQYTTTLGYGWTHNHDTRLIFPSMPGGEEGIVLFKAHSANLYRFRDNGDGTFTAEPGLTSRLVRQPEPSQSYSLVDQNQHTYTFDETGKLLKWADDQGHEWGYTYGLNGGLDRVTDDTGQRFLDFEYDSLGRIASVMDPTGRGVTFGYDDTTGDLVTVVDVLTDTWTYTYDSDHHLRIVTDPGNRTVVHTEYDPEGRAYQQYAPDDTLVLEITYNSDGTRTIRDALNHLETHVYDIRNTLVAGINDKDDVSQKSYDLNFRPNMVINQNNQKTQLRWDASGANLIHLLDASGNQTDLTYDQLNNLTSVIDPRSFLTTYAFSSTMMISSTNALGETTLYTYTTAADAPQPVGLVKEISDPLGHTTRFSYNEFGERLTMTDAMGLITMYSYDALGRLQTIKDPSGNINWTCYDASGRIIREVGNAIGDGSLPQNDPCDPVNYQESPNPDFDRISSTMYDDSGNVIGRIDHQGIVTRIYYDTNNRPITTTVNLVRQNIEAETPPVYDPNYPSQNVSTATRYDNQGNVIANIDALGVVSRTYYDELNRPIIVVQNLVGQGIEVSTPPVYNPNFPDQNIRTETIYDPVGNVIATIDPSGKVTRTYYDENNRPVSIVQNLVGQAIEESVPPVFDPNYPDQNVRSDTVYDENGNAIASIDPNGVVTRTFYDALNRPETVVQNLYPGDSNSIFASAPPVFDPNYPDRNLITDYVYDSAGNLIATVDPAGRVTRTYFDLSGRPVVVIQNLTGQAIEESTPPEFNPDYPDQNVRTETVYDAEGKAIATIDSLGHMTRTYYDAVDRPVIRVQNLTGQSAESETPPAFHPDSPDQNVRTETVYGPNGEIIATVDNNGSITRTYFDELNRPVTVVQNLTGQTILEPVPPVFDPNFPDRNLITSYVYDAAGRTVRTVGVDGVATHSCYDKLGRVVKTVLNPSVEDPCLNYTLSAAADEDLITFYRYDSAGNQVATTDPTGKESTFEYDGLLRLIAQKDPELNTTRFSYDGAGNRVARIDPRGIVTKYEYDSFGRLVKVIENFRPGVTPDHEINVLTLYDYDVLGNRIRIQDALSHETVFSYDDLSRLTGERDALSNQTIYGYDANGNRVSRVDANGATTLFTYDGSDRLVAIDYPDPTADVRFEYDALGNRKMMVDGLGVTEWSYDELNRPLSITDPFSSTVRYEYDATGHRTALIYPDQKSAAYGYDAAGRLETVSDWNSLTTTYAYDKAGRVQEVSLPNGVTSSFSYTEASELQALVHQRAGQVLSSFQYFYDENGNRTSVVEKLSHPAAHDTGFHSPGNSAADSGGDGNGFEVTPSNAFADDGVFAVDSNSGTNTSTSCTDAGKDKHQFSTFGFSVPADANVKGIEVRLDSKADSDRYSPQMCVQLSWDGGTTWTGAETTPVLSTGESTYLLGGSMNTWGRVWNGGELGDSSFGVRVINIASSKNTDFSLDWIAVKVYYEADTTIDYQYDPLNRLTAADYSDGAFFHYAYDPAGNLVSKQTASETTAYNYDEANRLVSVNGVSYTWDANGNLLADEVNTYTYDHANHLTGVAGPGLSTSYSYNGLGDRVEETANDVTTHFTLDLAAGLTQVLADGTSFYLYGSGRIGQQAASAMEYFLGDALGNVRQMTNASGAVILEKSYEPYGEVLGSTGNGASSYGFTGEWTDSYINFIYLRSRWYSPQSGRFLTRDTWQGDYNRPISYNKWLYAYANPIYFQDPTGFSPLTTLVDELDGKTSFNWGIAEETAIEAAAMDVAIRLARTINKELLLGFNRCERQLFPGKYKYPISPTQAFLAVYDGKVTFTHVDALCDEGCWGRSTGSRSITLYREAKVNENPRFIVHELGHSFENVLAKLLGKDSEGKDQKPLRAALEEKQSRDSNFPNRKARRVCRMVIDENSNGRNPRKHEECQDVVDNLAYGFAGLRSDTSINAWQQSDQVEAGEEFADMYIGWTYNQWESGVTGGWSPQGQARAAFMNDNMTKWVWYAFVH